MPIFGGYFDESGMHEGGTLGASPIIVMAGYIATADQWSRFSDEWQAVLDKHGIAYFHMADFNGGHKQFKGMSEDEKQVLIDKLTRLITVRARIGIIASFKAADYRAVISENQKLSFVRQYLLCSLMCMLTAKQWADQHGYREPIPYIFDRGARYSGEFKQGYDWFLRDYAAMGEEYLLGPFVLEDKKKFKPLQAADVLAYTSYRRMYNDVVDTPIPIKYPLPKLLDTPIVDKHFTGEDIKDIFAVLEKAESERSRDEMPIEQSR